MAHIECSNCKGLKACRKEFISWFFIIIGFVSTVALRIVTVLMNLSPFWGKLAWYIGVTGFFAFFMYKYRVFKERSKWIDDSRLIEKINKGSTLTDEDYKILSVILCQIRSNKERVNFLFIFIASGVALIAAIYFDLFVR
ncbi:MAG: hypothetical protein KJ736_05290 [Candidatus Omnitrophica bacterium]|nr:hypothetical protein [Candidatus Omnitrophota bacterium]